MSDCDAIVDALTRTSPSEAQLLSSPHLDGCLSCRQLVSVDRALSYPSSAPIRQGAALLAALDRDMTPVHHRSALRRAVLPFGALLAVMVSGATLLGRPVATTALPWLASLAMLTWAGLGAALVLRRGPSGLGAPVRTRRAWLAGSGALFVLSTLATTRIIPRTLSTTKTLADHVGVSAVNAVSVTHDNPLGPMQNLGACASTSLIFAAVVAVGLLWSSRRTVPVSSGSMGAVVGASAGLAAAAALQLSCATHIAHALAAHGLPMLLATVLCTFIGRRALAP